MNLGSDQITADIEEIFPNEGVLPAKFEDMYTLHPQQQSGIQNSSAAVRDLFSWTNMHPTFIHHSIYIQNTFSIIPHLMNIMHTSAFN